MKHFKSLTAILMMLTLVLASCGSQTPINDASSSTDSTLETEGFPPSGTTPIVSINAVGYQTVDLRVGIDLVKFFKVTYAGTKSVFVNITSDKDGSLFNGFWDTTVNPLGSNNSVIRTFTTPGTRVLTVTAVGAGRLSTGKVYLNVINTAPRIVLNYYDNPHVGENYWVTAQIFDKNEPDGVAMCANTTWTLDVKNTLDTSTGCRVKLLFSNVFTYQLRVTTRDSEGAEAVNAVNLTVLPAFVGPRLNASRSYLYEQNNSADGRTGQTIDLTGRFEYLNFDFDGQRPNDATRYRTVWTVFVTDTQGLESTLYTVQGIDTGLEQSGFSSHFYPTEFFPTVGGTAPITRDCRIAVEITYLGSIGTVPVWVGKCTYNTQKLN
jgi:hypothetical protein